jgi:signal transduction histidine kinase
VQNRKSPVNLSLAVSIILIGLWMLGTMGLQVLNNIDILYGRALFITGLLGVQSLLVFASTLTSQAHIQTLPRPLISATVVISLLVSALTLSPQMIESVVRTSAGQPTPQYGHLFLLYGATIFLLGVLMAIELTRAARHADEKYKPQILLVQRTIIIAVGLALLTNLVLPQLLDTPESARYAPVAVFILLSGLTYAVVRHGLLNIKSFVLRAAAYTSSTSVLVMLYIAPIVYVCFSLLNVQFEIVSFLTVVIIFSLVAANYSRLSRRFNNLTRKIFFRDAYDPAELLAEMNQVLVSTIDLKELLQGSSEVITKYLNPEFCNFILVGPNNKSARQLGTDANRQLSVDNHELREYFRATKQNVIISKMIRPTKNKVRSALVDLDIGVAAILKGKRAGHTEILGYLLVGERKSGKEYELEEIKVFDAIANTLVIAMQNALHFEEIQRFNATLQQRVEEATRQLKRTNAKLEALDETKDDFISMASHQLRTPLTSVKGYISMVMDGDAGKINPTQRKMLGQAFISSQRMVYLIADLLNVSRLKTGKFVIEQTPTNLAKLITEEVGQLIETAASRNIKLSYDRPAHFPLLMLDETKTRQVIMNFVDNAIYYTPSGGRITVSLIEKPSAVELRVQDDGIGVPASEQHHLFTKFYRARNAQKARPDGTGLGLFMAKKVIAAQGGAVIFESKEGKGSTFGFTFSKSKLVVPETTPDSSPVTASAAL